MTIKKSLEDIILLLKNKNVDKRIIYDFLIKIGFDEERVTSEMMKLSILDKVTDKSDLINSDEKINNNIHNYKDETVKVIDRLIKIEQILEKYDNILFEIYNILKKSEMNKISI